MLKTRLIAIIMAILLIPIGLVTRQYGNDWMKLYLGDVLWAAMIYWGFKFLLDQVPKRTAFYALIFCFSIEFSQLYHEPWIDEIRDNRMGGLVLGFGFLWSDLICYSMGVFVSFWVDDRFFSSHSFTSPLPNVGRPPSKGEFSTHRFFLRIKSLIIKYITFAYLIKKRFF